MTKTVQSRLGFPILDMTEVSREVEGERSVRKPCSLSLARAMARSTLETKTNG